VSREVVMKKTAIVGFILVLVLVAVLAGCGTPKQKEVKSSSTTSNEKPKEEMALDKVGFVPESPGDAGTSYVVVGKMVNNNPDYACLGAPIIVSLYNAQGLVLGTENLTLSVLYPNSYRWLVSKTMDVNGQVPAKAEIKIKTDGHWKKTSDKTPPFEVIQKNYLPAEYSSKITGVVKYTGKKVLSEKAVIKVVGVLLDANGDPLGARSNEMGNVTTAGDYPFEISLGTPPVCQHE
jgi:hypothetical protein